MASIKKESKGRKDLFMIDPRKIVMKEGWNVRQETPELEEHIWGLSVSISELGVQQPLTVYMDDGTIYLSDGHCRLKATLLAIDAGSDIQAVPCRVEERGANEADRVLAMVTRNSGKPLTPLEKSLVVKKLIGFGWTEDNISRKMGMTVQYVGKLLEMQEMPEEMKNMINEGTVSATLALEECKREGGQQAVENIKTVVEKSPKKKVTKKVLKKSPKKKTPDATVYNALEIIREFAVNCEEDEAVVLEFCSELEAIFIDHENNSESSE